MRLRRPFTILLMLVISLLMTAAPVFPHHHHADGQICMKNDFHHDCGDEAPLDHHASDASCDASDCPTHHFFRPSPDAPHQLTPPQVTHHALFMLPVQRLMHLLYRNQRHTTPHRRDAEPLHSVLLARTPGLRAPPLD